jgi:hypothetical protein
MNEWFIEILTKQEEGLFIFDLEENKTCLVVQEYTPSFKGIRLKWNKKD